MSTHVQESDWRNRYSEGKQDEFGEHFDLSQTPEAALALGGALHVLSWREGVEDDHFPVRQPGADLLG